jgi:hypothetical protein
MTLYNTVASEYLTRLVFEWSILAGSGVLIPYHSKTGNICLVFEWFISLDHFRHKDELKHFSFV